MSDYDTAFDEAFPGVRADIEQRLSDRCTELAALEREIGRLYLAIDYLISASDQIERGEWSEGRYPDDDALNILGSRRDECEEEQDAAHTRWRELHAAGAEK